MKRISLHKLSFKNLATPLLALSLVAGCAGLFGGSVGAASVTVTIPESSWEDAVILYGPSGGGMPGAGSTSGWDVDFNPSPVWSNGSPGSSSYIDVPDCVTSDIRIDLAMNYSQIKSGLGKTVVGAFIGNADETLFTTPAFSGISSSPQSGTFNLSATITRAQYDQAPVLVMIGMDEVSGSHWVISNRLATFTYDNSSCPVVATDPDISTTPSSTPVTINILGNDTGTGLNVSKIDNQTITSGDTITLSNGSGTVKLNTDGTITFTPNSTFSGESIFSYSITDGASTVDTGVVRITVAAATTTNTTTTTTTTTPSNPAASSASTNNTKVLAKTGEDVRLLAGGGMLVLVAAIYIANLRFKLGKY
jgi:hypothetical protein